MDTETNTSVSENTILTKDTDDTNDTSNYFHKLYTYLLFLNLPYLNTFPTRN